MKKMNADERASGALVSFLESEFQSMGIEQFHLNTGIRNAKAQALYVKLGYARNGYFYSK